METKKEHATLAEALVAAQSEMHHAKMDRINPHFKNRYATLASVLDACRTILNGHGIALVQKLTSNADSGTVGVTTRLLFKGESLDCGELTMKAVQNNPQQIGSALTYARRYSLATAVGIASDDDDDGEAASGPGGNGNGGGNGGSRITPAGATSTPRAAPPSTVVQPTPAHVDPTPTQAPPVHLPGGSTVTTRGGPRTQSPEPPPGTLRIPAAPDAPSADGGESFLFRVGKHKGVDAREVEIGYLRWYADAQEKSPEKWQGKRWEADTRHEIAVCRSLIAAHDAAKDEPPPNVDDPADAGAEHPESDLPF